jgi:hypothetical protein
MTDQQGTALPWKQRISMLSVNPDAATRDDVASLAEELMIANHKAARAEEAERLAHQFAKALEDIIQHQNIAAGKLVEVSATSVIARQGLLGYEDWKKSR